MTRILFISSLAFYDHTGGAQCSKRNYTILQEIFGTNKVIPYALVPFNKKSKTFDVIVKTFINLCKLRQNGLTAQDENNIIEIINKENIQKVFIDCSINGSLIRLIKKKTSAIVYSFFHNCEYELISQYVKKGNLFQFPRLLSCYLNEKLTCKYADCIIGLNERDQGIIYKQYNRTFNYIIPISLSCEKEEYPKSNKIEPIDILFVGSNFFPNVQGINWFIKNVIPYIKKRLVIIGRGLEYASIIKHERVEIIGSVDSIQPYYDAAKLVVIPIFNGSGMKVKTAEAMKFGKVIIGTQEAFEGYIRCKGMYECNSKEEFINCFNTIKDYTSETETLFKKEYSHEVMTKKFHDIFS